MVSVMLYPCILCVPLLMDLFVLRVGVILLLNIMEVLSVGGVLCWIDCVWSYKGCACCVCDPSVNQSVPSIGFVYVFVCRKLYPHLRV